MIEAAPVLLKPPPRVPPILGDYEAECASFTWERARAQLAGLPGGRGLNIAHEAVDRHATGRLRERVALRWRARGGCRRDLRYDELAAASSRFANVLTSLGVRRGDRVFVLTERIPELYVTMLGALKVGAVACPLYSAFGPEPIRQRVELGQGRVLIASEALYRRKVAAIRPDLATLEHVLLVRAQDGGELPEGVLDLGALIAAASDRFEIPPTDPEEPALLHFTSGTTGKPKGAIHVHEAVLAHHATGGWVLDLHPDDVFWCTADPGWVTGTSYGIVAPLTHGVTSVVYAGEFDAEAWYRLIAEERVTVWYTAPTAIRMLMRAGPELAARFDLSSLRLVASVGEALNAEAVVWGQEAWGLPIHDNWWQTETGGIMIANFPVLDIRPGSMGKPVPGVEAGIVRRREDGVVEEVTAVDTVGEIALRPGWPSMFRGYLGQEERYRKCFAGGWYLSGDLARRDADGYYWFVGRGDDVIKSMGHLIGPFEVESALMEHPAVVEAAVIGVPDPIGGELVKAFVSLERGYQASEELLRDIHAHARRRLGPAVAPKEVVVAEDLPRTRSGKILRRLLRARELGLPEGDLSTLEPPA
jgi:acetyl-CoA synthetase